LKNIPVVRNL